MPTTSNIVETRSPGHFPAGRKVSPLVIQPWEWMVPGRFPGLLGSHREPPCHLAIPDKVSLATGQGVSGSADTHDDLAVDRRMIDHQYAVTAPHRAGPFSAVFGDHDETSGGNLVAVAVPSSVQVNDQ